MSLIKALVVALSVGAQQTLRTDWLDQSVSPTADFYQFANGGWLKQTELAPDLPSANTFESLELKNRGILRTLVEEASKERSLKRNTVKRKVGLFYRVAMDGARAKQQGIHPIDPELKMIEHLRDANDLALALARLNRIGVTACFNAGIRTSPQPILAIAQGGLGLPDRDLFSAQDERSKSIRSTYRSVIVQAFVLSGETANHAQSNADRVIAIETRLAAASSSRVMLRDAKANTNKFDLAGIQALTPQFPWAVYWKVCGQSSVKVINVAQPKYFAEFGRAVTEEPIESWRCYLRFRLLQEASPYLDSKFFENSFRLTSALYGVPKMPERWEMVTETLDDSLGEAVGQMYVEKVFSPIAKQKAEAIFENLRNTLQDRIKTADWMGDQTKSAALQKLAAMGDKIGYPDQWKDYSKLEIRDDSYVRNIFRIGEWGFDRMMARLKKSVSRREWNLTPATVNASYSNSRNEIVVPAGILQPPFFDPQATDAENYGGIGMVIAHEMTHAFDDQGRHYDKSGTLADWWSPEDAKKFEAITAALIDQFGSYEVSPGQKVNGKLTVGENIADLGGLQLAFQTYQRVRSRQRASKIDGFSQDQQFFLAFAQIWKEKATPEYGRLMLTTNPHAPGPFRVKGLLENTPQFWEAWGVKPPPPKVKIW